MNRQKMIASVLRQALKDNANETAVQAENFEVSKNFNPLTLSEKQRLVSEFGLHALRRHGLSVDSWLPEGFERD